MADDDRADIVVGTPTDEVAKRIEEELSGLSEQQLFYVEDELLFVALAAEIDPSWAISYAPWARPSGSMHATRWDFTLGILSQVDQRLRFVAAEKVRRGLEA